MTEIFYSLITNQGLIKHAAVAADGNKTLDLATMVVGDGDGSYHEPKGDQKFLVHQTHAEPFPLNMVVEDETNPNQIIIEGILDETVGPFYIREVGILDSEGILFAVGKYPETFKPNLPVGSGKKLFIRMILEFSSSPNVTISYSDENVELHNRMKISENLADLGDVQAARNNLELGSAALAGDALENAKGIAQIATQAEVNNGNDDQRIITPQKLRNGSLTIENLTIDNKLKTSTKTATISSGAITYTGSYMVIDTEEGAVSDDLDTINGGVDGDLLTIEQANGARDITLKATGGNIKLTYDQDLALEFSSVDSISFRYNGAESKWVMVSRNLEKDFRFSKEENGYTYLPNGIIMQWGVISNVSLNEVFHTATFPKIFPNSIFNVSATISMNAVVNGSIGTAIRTSSISNSGMQIVGDYSHGASTGNIYWSVIGH
ncbi:MAG: phage-related tail fiber protein [Rickettsiales bacterium]|jgi:phage-related tail fiber protein